MKQPDPNDVETPDPEGDSESDSQAFDDHTRTFALIKEWEKFYKERKGEIMTIKTNHSSQIEVEFCFPVGAPL